MSLLLTLSTLYLLEEAALEGAQTEPLPPATTTPASVKGLPAGPGLWIHGEQPLSCLSSVLCYRLAPGDLRLVFYDEVGVGAEGMGAWGAGGAMNRVAFRAGSLWGEGQRQGCGPSAGQLGAQVCLPLFLAEPEPPAWPMWFLCSQASIPLRDTETQRHRA